MAVSRCDGSSASSTTANRISRTPTLGIVSVASRRSQKRMASSRCCAVRAIPRQPQRTESDAGVPRIARCTGDALAPYRPSSSNSSTVDVAPLVVASPRPRTASIPAACAAGAVATAGPPDDAIGTRGGDGLGGGVTPGATTSAADAAEPDPGAATAGTGSAAIDATCGSDGWPSLIDSPPPQPTLSANNAASNAAAAVRPPGGMPARRAWSRSRRPITLPARRSEGPGRRDRAAGARAAHSR